MYPRDCAPARTTRSEEAMHDVQANASVGRMLEGFGNRADDAEAQRLPQTHGGGVGFYHRVELHRGVAALARPVQRVLAQRPPDAQAARILAHHETGRGDM